MLDYLALLHDDDGVVVGDGVESVGDRDDGAAVELGLECALNEVVRAQVHVRGGLVQHKDPAVAQDRPRQAHQLLLAHGEYLGAARNVGVQFVLQLP